MKYLLLALLLTGCACPKQEPIIQVVTKEVQVMVDQPYPKIPDIAHPVLEITKIAPGQPPGTIVQAYQVTVQQLLNLVEQLEAQIAGVNKNAR